MNCECCGYRIRDDEVSYVGFDRNNECKLCCDTCARARMWLYLDVKEPTEDGEVLVMSKTPIYWKG